MPHYYRRFFPSWEDTLIITNALGKLGSAQKAALSSLADVQLCARPLLTWDVETYEASFEGRAGHERTLTVVSYDHTLRMAGAKQSPTKPWTGNEETLRTAPPGNW